MKILFASSEVFPLIKTGGLADVSASLPRALKTLRQDVRIVMPAYLEVLEGLKNPTVVAEFTDDGESARLLESRLPGSRAPLYLLDCPRYFARAGDPYRSPDGRDWQDNHLRFGYFNRIIARLALDQAGLEWRPDILHCNDWQSALAPALLHAYPERPGVVFTAHNLAYQGLFPWEAYKTLGLPDHLMTTHGLEFFGKLSFIKGGLVYADRITTVSPTYAQEIRTPSYGYGLEGLLLYRGDDLVGIMNGIDPAIWDPAHDRHLKRTYDASDLAGKAANKRALQAECGLPEAEQSPLVGHIGRLVEQKGIDLTLAALPRLLESQPKLQTIVLGSGEKRFEQALKELAKRYPRQLAVHIGYDEALAHRIEAGADIFVMPSRFEPCGLNQLYSLRYGTVPVVRRTGGLADSVVDVAEGNIADGTATGFIFDKALPDALRGTLERALALYPHTQRWHALMLNGMQRDFSWQKSAKRYLELYSQLRKTRPT
ncbi:MAG: glycogen synthase GlgA [Gammaproteobacteria bacterium]|jgi:starch synthase